MHGTTRFARRGHHDASHAEVAPRGDMCGVAQKAILKFKLA
jgi:hypothetical protein